MNCFYDSIKSNLDFLRRYTEYVYTLVKDMEDTSAEHTAITEEVISALVEMHVMLTQIECKAKLHGLEQVEHNPSAIRGCNPKLVDFHKEAAEQLKAAREARKNAGK